MDQTHHLAAILFTDIEGFTALMQRDEHLAIKAVQNHNEVVALFARKYLGEVSNFYGDGCLVIFHSSTNALECAIAIQSELWGKLKIPIRISLHLGEVIMNDDKVIGDGINIASRIQTLGLGNSILMSSIFHDNIKNHPEFKTVSLGEFHFKNVKDHIEVFALANEGLNVPKKSRIRGKLEEKKGVPKSKIVLVLAPLILILIAFLIYITFPGKINPSPEERSIAVLAFTDMSSKQDQEYLSDGIAEEILNNLCKFPELKVVARTSSFSFKKKEVDISTIGEKLNVNNILEGSVRKNLDQIIITVRLTNAKSGFTLLSESYTDELNNIFDLQSRIAIDIAEKIEAKLSLTGKKLLNRKPINPAAYEMYLRGRSQFVNGPLNMQSGEIIKAKKYFEAAIAIDSTFAEAQAFLSLTFFNLADWALPNSDRNQIEIARDSATLLAKKSLKLDSLSSGAHLAMGSYYFHQYNWIEAEKEKRKAVQLNPGGAEEKFILASFLGQFGKTEEALRLDQEAMKLDPLDPNSRLKYARDLYRARKFDEGIYQCELVLQEQSNSTGAYQFLNLCYSGKGQFDKAKDAVIKLSELMGEKKVAEMYEGSSYFEGIKKYVEYINNTKPIEEQNWNELVQYYAVLGDNDNTFKYLNLILENHLTSISFLCQHAFDSIRDDPRYIQILEKADLKKYYNTQDF